MEEINTKEYAEKVIKEFNEKTDGKAVYPSEIHSSYTNDMGGKITISGYNHGLMKRELFAGMAMQGMLSKSVDGYMSDTDIVELSVRYADLLIKELNKPKDENK